MRLYVFLCSISVFLKKNVNSDIIVFFSVSQVRFFSGQSEKQVSLVSSKKLKPISFQLLHKNSVLFRRLSCNVHGGKLVIQYITITMW